MAAVEVDEALLVVALLAVVELLAEPLLDLGDELGGVERAERLAQEHADQVGVLQVGGDRLGDARVLHLDGDRPFAAGVRVADHGPMDLADRRRGDRLGIPLEEELLGRTAELLGDHLGGELAAHRRGVGLQLGEGVAHRFGQPVVEVAGHLADLHQRALHAARGARRPARRCAAAARRRSRRVARREANSLRADAAAYVDPTPRPMRASWRLRAERDVCETGRRGRRVADGDAERTSPQPTPRRRRRRRRGQPLHDARATDGVDRRDERRPGTAARTRRRRDRRRRGTRRRRGSARRAGAGA